MNVLKEQIKNANEAYRVGSPVMSDHDYDALLDKLETMMGMIEFEYFKQTLTESKGTIKLDYVLGSLSKMKYEEPENFFKWVKKNSIKDLFASLKVDGCSFSASYRNGLLVQCASRGDSETGTDWTEKSKYILPTIIPFLQDLDIRGEFTLTNDSHTILGFKNRRNGTVGIMNQDKIDPEKLKYVKAIAYEVLSGSMDIEEQFHFLKDLNFLTPETITFPLVIKRTPEGLKSFYEDMKSFVNYDIDGLVISSPNHKRENVFFPEGKVAFKINSAGVETTITDIEWNMSKGGKLVPTVLVTPITFDGSTVSRVTGIHYQNVKEKGLGRDAIITIRKSGQIIPEIVEVVKPVPFFKRPVICPSCGYELEIKSVDLVCTNIDCKDKNLMIIESFLIKNGVENVTYKSLSSWGIFNFNDLLSFDPDTNSKSQDNFSRELSLKIFSKTKEELFSNMNFDGASTTNINKLIDFYGQGDLISASKVLYIERTGIFFDLVGFPEGIGQKTIDKIEVDWKLNLSILNTIIKDRRYNPKAKVVKQVVKGNLSGQSFLLTGTLSEGRKQIEQRIIDSGGIIASSVSKTLSTLVCGQDSWGSSTKYLKAVKMNIKVITEDELNKMI